MSLGQYGIDSWGGRAVFGLHAAAAVVMIGLGARSIAGSSLAGGLIAVVIGLMLIVVGWAAGRITARR